VFTVDYGFSSETIALVIPKNERQIKEFDKKKKIDQLASDNKKEMKKLMEFQLFEPIGSGVNNYYSPRSDEQIDSFVKTIMKTKKSLKDLKIKEAGDDISDHHFLVTEEKSEWLSKIKSYYEAIGRIFLHAMLDKEKVVSSVMLDLIRNAIFLSVRPDNECYCSDDLMNSLNGVVEKGEFNKVVDDGATFDDCFNDGNMEIVNKDNFKSFLLRRAKLMLDDRCYAIDAMNKGVTLGGRFDIGQSFYKIPVEEVLVKLIFTKPNIEADDLISVLTKKSLHNNDRNPDEISTLYKTQKTFVHEVMPNIIKEWTYQERSQFIMTCTGNGALPYQMSNDKKNSFKICIEFNDFDIFGDDHLPVFHTCENAIKLPFTAYGGSGKKFLQKLQQVYDYNGTDGFGMQ